MDLIIYHENCADGITAAAIAKDVYPNATLHPASYGDDPPDVTGLDVLIVDFSYPRDVLEGKAPPTALSPEAALALHMPDAVLAGTGLGMAARAKSFLVLDHHKTAQAALEGLPYARFDTNKSGASMTWEHLHPKEPAPWLVRYVEDGDLWRFALPGSREVRAYLQSLPFDVEVWQKHLAAAVFLSEAIGQGAAIRRTVEKYSRTTAKTAHVTTFAGVENVPVVNATYMFTSELLHCLAPGHPFAVAWRYVDGKYRYSLRSEPEGADVGETAGKFGGGGHKHAAGCESTTPIDGTFECPGELARYTVPSTPDTLVQPVGRPPSTKGKVRLDTMLLGAKFKCQGVEYERCLSEGEDVRSGTPAQNLIGYVCRTAAMFGSLAVKRTNNTWGGLWFLPDTLVQPLGAAE